MTAFAIRDAGPADLPAIRALHAASWRRFYAGVLPPEVLGPSLDAVMTGKWTPARLAAFEVIAAVGPEGLIGFAAVDPAHPDGPLLDNLHVAEAAQRGGVGRALLAAVAARLRARGADSLWLEVLDANRVARAAYAALGGREGPVFADRLLGCEVPARRVEWRELSGLARAGGVAAGMARPG